MEIYEHGLIFLAYLQSIPITYIVLQTCFSVLQPFYSSTFFRHRSRLLPIINVESNTGKPFQNKMKYSVFKSNKYILN